MRAWWLGLLLSVPTAVAQETATWNVSFDGVPVWVTVVARDHDGRPHDETMHWWQWGNTTTDAYLFATNQPDNVRLVLAFERRADDRASVRVYTADAPIRVQTDRADLGIDRHATLVVDAHDGDWLIEGQPNYDLTIWRDGLPLDHPYVINGLFEARPDGTPNLRTESRGVEPGVPSWQTTLLLTDPRPSWSLPRFDLRWRMQDDVPFRTVDPVMPTFPLLGITTSSPDWFAVNPAPIQFDPLRGTLREHAIPGLQTGGMYTIISTSSPPNLGFETPFVFYAFEPPSRRAHLVVRAQHSAGPETVLGGRHRTTFRYAWKTDDTVWRYALFVAGFEPYDDTLTFGAHTFPAIAPEDLPTWVTSRRWPVVSFVETMDRTLGSARGSEGVYFYNLPQSNAVVPWLAGLSDEEPTDFAQPYLPADDALTARSELGLPIGYRGQYGAAHFREPELYIHPIDRVLHLLYAQGGVWNVGDGRVLRYHNLSGDAYTDGWTRERMLAAIDVEAHHGTEELPRAHAGMVEEAVYAFADYLLHADDAGVTLQRRMEPSAYVRTTVPHDAPSWQAFRDTLEATGDAPRDPFDMRSWLDPALGPSSTVASAHLEHVRRDGALTRFELVSSGEASTGMIDLSVLTDLAAGRFVIRHDAMTDQWTRESAAPADLTWRLVSDDAVAFRPGLVELTVHNPSNLDRREKVVLSIGDEVIDEWDAFLIPEGEIVRRIVTWTPRRAGTFDALVTFGHARVPLQRVHVRDTPRVSGAEATALASPGRPLMHSVLLALVTGTTIALLATIWRGA